MELALEGRITEHHHFMLRLLLEQLDSARETMLELEQEIDGRMRPCEEVVNRLRTIPGVERVTAWELLAELGFNMDQFPSGAHVTSWAGLCPGSFESAGKRSILAVAHAVLLIAYHMARTTRNSAPTISSTSAGKA